MRLVLPQHIVKKAATIISVVGFLLALVSGDKAYLIVAVTICLCGLLFGNHLSGSVAARHAALWRRSTWCSPDTMYWCVPLRDLLCVLGVVCVCSYVLSADDGDEEMRRVSNPIREGAEGTPAPGPLRGHHERGRGGGRH